MLCSFRYTPMLSTIAMLLAGMTYITNSQFFFFSALLCFFTSSCNRTTTGSNCSARSTIPQMNYISMLVLFSSFFVCERLPWQRDVECLCWSLISFSRYSRARYNVMSDWEPTACESYEYIRDMDCNNGEWRVCSFEYVILAYECIQSNEKWDNYEINNFKI